MPKITFLGPYGATFTHDAYNVLSEAFGTPKATEADYVPAFANGEVLNIIAEHGGYGAIAMETLAGCRVDESTKSFIDLLKRYKSPEECTFHVVGAVAMKLHFCLMIRTGLTLRDATSIVSHEKSFDACRQNIARLNLPTETVPSNGEAARRVAEDSSYATAAALGPRSAAEKYDLCILADGLEDEEAITTFFLIAPRTHAVAMGENNRALLVFSVPNEPGAETRVQIPLMDQSINMVNLHSFPIGRRAYRFIIETEMGGTQVGAMERAMKSMRRHMIEHLYFGPFQVLSR